MAEPTREGVAANRPKTRPLRRGARVRHVEIDGLFGSVVDARQSGRRWLYTVRWDGYEHDSGDYGIRTLAEDPRG